MTQEERLIDIEARVKSYGKITIEEICQTYDVSYDSARRDLVKLSSRPGILRIRGGAILDEKKISLTYHKKEIVSPIKEKLALFCAALVSDEDILFLDAGTTCIAIARHLDIPSSVISNSLECLYELREKRHIKKRILGGSFDDYFHAILGETTTEQTKKYRASKAFLGVCALSEVGITTDLESDANLKKVMADQATKVICVTESSKFNTQLMYQSCLWSDIDLVITDKRPPENIHRQLERYDVELVIVD